MQKANQNSLAEMLTKTASSFIRKPEKTLFLPPKNERPSIGVLAARPLPAFIPPLYHGQLPCRPRPCASEVRHKAEQRTCRAATAATKRPPMRANYDSMASSWLDPVPVYFGLV